MPKYLSGRVKRRDQAYLSTDRYQYLGLDQAEPNLGDPADPLFPKPPPGSQFQIVSVRERPGERFWVPIGGGIIPGSISVFDEGVLVGTEKSITQLNFEGLAVTADAVPGGIAATITVAPPGPNNRILYKDNGEFQSSQFLVFKDNVGIGSVGIGTNNPTENLHIVGNLRLESAIVDEDNFIGNTGDLLVKTSTGGLRYTDQRSVQVSAAGSVTQVQFHDSTGLLGGADNFVFDFTNNRIGIGSTQPDRLLDVLGDSRFTGFVNFTDDIFVGVGATVGFGTTAYFRDNASAVFGGDEGFRITRTDTLKDQTNSEGGRITFDDYVSIIEDRGVGPLVFKSNGGGGPGAFQFFDTNWRPLLKMKSGGSDLNEQVILYFDGQEKLSTTGEGILVSGGTTTGDLRVTGFGTFENRVAIGSHVDMPNDARIRLGLNDDLQIYHETSGDTVIHENGSGDLVIRSANLVVKNSDGDNTYFTATNGGSVDLFHNNNLRFRTTGFGVTIFETTETQQLKVSGVSTFQDDIFVGVGATVGFGTTAYFRDNAKAVFGDDEDLKIYHSGEHSYIQETGTGNLFIDSSYLTVRNGAGNQIVASFTHGTGVAGGVQLYFGNSKKFQTQKEGILVSGGTTTGTLSVTGVSTFQDDIFIGTGATVGFGSTAYFRDDAKAIFGDNEDLLIYHDRTEGHSYVKDFGTGNLTLQSDSAVEMITFNPPLGGGSEKMLVATKNEGVKLYFDGNEKIKTTEEGILVSGGTTTGTLSVTGLSTFAGITTVTGETLFTKQLNVSGVSTFVNDAEFKGNVSIAGTLTYEDVTNVDAIGLITARNGIHVTGGEVGIGTDTPNHLLHVVQKSTDAYGTGVARFEYYDTDDTGGGSPDQHYDAKFIPTGTYIKSFVTGSGTDFLIVDADNTAGRHSFAVEGNAGDNKSFTVDSTGLVGIGTANPQSLLTLGASSNPVLEFKDYTNNARSQILGSAGGQLVFQTDITRVNANSDFIFRADGGDSTYEIVRFKDTGEVGIGTDNPTGTNALTNNNSTLAVGIVTTNSLHTHDLSVSGVSTFQDDIFVGVGATVGFGTTAYFRDDANIILGDDEGFRINRTETLRSQTNSLGGRITFDRYVSIIEDRGDGPLVFKSNGGGGPGAFQFFDNGWRTLLKMKSGSDPSVLLYHLGEERLQTNEQGILVSGGTTTGKLSVTGVSTFVDNAEFRSSVGIGTNNPTGTDALTNNNATLAVGIVTTNSLFSRDLKVSGISTFSNNILPATTNSVDIGESESLRFNRIYAREIFAETNTINENQEIGTLKVTGVSTFIGLSTFSNGIEVVSGTAVFDGNIDANGNLDVDGQTDLDVLNVAELATFEGNIDANADLDVDGHTELDNLNVSGVSTFVNNAEFKANVSIAGTLTYEDVTNVDSIGLITARNGIHVTGAGVSVAGISTFINTVEFQDKVGIGTTNPQVHDLHVNGDAFVDGDLFLRDRFDSKVKLNGQSGSLEIHADGVVRLIESDHDKEMITFDINTTHNDGRIYFEGDKDTFLNHPGDDQLGLAAGGFEIIRITSDTMSIGNTVPNMKVGIGTDNPTGENALTDNNSTLAVGIITTNSSFTHDLKVSGVSTFVGLSTFSSNIFVEATTDTNQLNVSGVSTFVGVVTTGNDLFVGGDITISNPNPTLTFIDTSGTPNNPDYRIIGNAGKLAIQDIQDGTAERFVVNAGGLIEIEKDLDIGRDLKVSGVSTFKDDVEFHGASGIASITFDKSANELNFKDDVKLTFGDDGTTDSQIHFDGANLNIKETSPGGSLRLDGHNIFLRNPTQSDEIYLKCNGQASDRSVELYHQGEQRLETTKEGIIVSGGTTTGDFKAIGVSTFQDDIFVGTGATVGFGSTVYFRDNVKAVFGDNDNLLIEHLTNGDSRIIEAGSGNLYIGVGGEISNSTFNINASSVGASAYNLSGSDRNGSVSGTSSSGSEINVTLNVGDTVNFVVNASGHPFFIKTAATTGTVDQASGVTNNGAQNGTVSWTPDTVGTYYFICRYHGIMVGTITVQSNSASGGRNLNITEGFSANYLAQFKTNNSVDLYFNRNLKFKTTNEGILVSGGTTTGDLRVTGVSTFQDDIFVGVGATVGFGTTAYFRDNAKAVFGDDEDLEIYHDEEHSVIKETGTGRLKILTSRLSVKDSSDTNFSIDASPGSFVKLFHDGNGRLTTTEEGILVSGGTTTGDFKATGVSTFQDDIFVGVGATVGFGTTAYFRDNAKAVFGDDEDLQIFHSGSNSVIKDGGTGSLIIAGNAVEIKNPTGIKVSAKFLENSSVELNFDDNEKLRTTNEGILVSGGTTTGTLSVTGVSTFVGVSTFNDQIFTNKISNSGIITSNMIHLTGGSFTAPHPSGDTQSDTAIVVNENFGIYSLELQSPDNDNRYLRSIIQKDSNVLTIGQDNTSLYAAINIRPGNAGTVSIGHSGAVSLVGVSEDGNTPNIEKLRTVGTGITVFGNTETQTLNVSGISTFNDNTIIDGSLTVGSNHSSITGGAPTDQGNLAVYGTGKNSLIIQTTSNINDRGIAWRNSGDNYVAYIAAVNRGSSEADLRFGVSNNTSNVDAIPERMRITKEGNVGINSTAPIAKLDVDGSFHVSGNIGIGSTIPIAKLDVNGQTDLDVLNVSDTATFDANINANGNIVGDNATAITGISRISGSTPAVMAVQNVQYVGRSNDPYAGSFLHLNDQNVPPFGAGGNFTTLASISGLNLIYDTNDNDNNGFVVGVGSTNVSDANAFTAHMVIDHTGKVGFGTNNPDQKLHVYKGSAGTVTSDSNAVITIENDNHSVLQILSPSNRSGRIMFGDPDDVNVGQISYDHNASPEKLIFDVGGSTRVAINSEGSLLPGGSSQDIGADENRWNTLFVNEVNASGGSIVVDNYETNILKVNGISTFIGLSTFADGIQVVSGIATFDGAIDANGGANIDGGLVVNSAKISDLTENRVVIVGSDGELGDSANLTFNGSLLNVTGGVAFSGDIDANANLDVDGHTELDNLNVSGVSTFVNNAEFKANVSIAGTLTYEDVTNVDAIGLITARNGIHVTGAGVSVAGISTFINDVEFRSKIGIGTTNPQQELHIQNNVPIIRLTKQNGETDNKHWNISAGNTQNLRIQAIRDDGGGGGQLFDFYRNAGDVEELRGKSGAAFWFTISNNNRNVGIGSTTPTEQLDVAGNINVGGGTTLQSSTTTGTGKALRIISPSGYIEVGSQNDNNAHFYTDRPRFYFNKRLIVDEGIIGSFNEDLVFVTDQTENRIRIKNGTGDVGIGQDDPTSRLHVTDSVDNAGIATLLTLHSIRTDMITGQVAGGSIRFLNEDGNNKGQAFIQANCPNIYDNDLGNEGERERTVDFNFVQSNASLNNLNTRLTIKGETGNVGIGTTRPDGRLHVSDGNAIVTGGSFGIGTTNPLLPLDVRGSLGISAVTDTSLRTTISSSSAGLIINHGDNSPTIFQNAGIERVRFKDTGEVGIGTDTPTTQLHVVQKSTDSYGTGVARFEYYDTDDTGGGSPDLHFDAKFIPTGTYIKSFVTGAGTDFLIVDEDNTAGRHSFAVEGNAGNVKSFTVDSTGLVGVKTNDPQYDLHVIGTAAATNFDSLSDRKVKTNIQVIQNPIDKIKKIDGVSFNWKSDNKPSLGVIADNVEEVLPEIVSGNDPKSVNYNGLIGLLIEVVKDQQKQIDELRGLLDK